MELFHFSFRHEFFFKLGVTLNFDRFKAICFCGQIILDSGFHGSMNKTDICIKKNKT